MKFPIQEKEETDREAIKYLRPFKKAFLGSNKNRYGFFVSVFYWLNKLSRPYSLLKLKQL